MNYRGSREGGRVKRGHCSGDLGETHMQLVAIVLCYEVGERHKDRNGVPGGLEEEEGERGTHSQLSTLFLI